MIFSLPASKISLFSLPFHTFWSVFFLYLKPFSPLPFFPFFVLFFDISPLTYKRTLFSRQYTVAGKIPPHFYKFFCWIFFLTHRHSHFSAQKHHLLFILPHYIKDTFLLSVRGLHENFTKIFLVKSFFFDMRLQKHWIGGYIADSDTLLFGQTDNKKGARQTAFTLHIQDFTVCRAPHGS